MKVHVVSRLCHTRTYCAAWIAGVGLATDSSVSVNASMLISPIMGHVRVYRTVHRADVKGVFERFVLSTDLHRDY